LSARAINWSGVSPLMYAATPRLMVTGTTVSPWRNVPVSTALRNDEQDGQRGDEFAFIAEEKLQIY
jgi:hypothetical protein